MKLELLIKELLVSKKLGVTLVFLFILPLIIGSLIDSNYPRLDWQQFEQRYQAIRITLLDYGQLPGNNPWAGGGTPIINSFYGIFSIFSIIFGVKIGLKLSVLFYYVIGYIGAYKLGIDLKFQKNSTQFFALYFIFSNSLAWHLYAGHIIFINILLLPYLIYLLINIAQNKYNLILFGIMLAIGFIDGSLYTGQYLVISTLLTSIYLIIKSKRKFNNLILNITAYILFLTISTYYIFMLYPYFIEYPRIIARGLVKYSILDSIKLISIPSILFEENIIDSQFCTNTHENANYLGFTLLASLLILVLNRKYYAFLPLLIAILPFLGDQNYFSLYYYLKFIPGFASHLCTSRIRLITPFLIGLLICFLIKRGDFNNLKIFKFEIKYKYILFLIISDIFIFSSIPIYESFNFKDNIKIGLYDKSFRNYRNANGMRLSDLTENNIGILDSSDSNIPINNISRSLGNNYKGEFLQGNEKITPIYWSPNEIVFKSLNSTCIDTNIPYSSGWKLNGLTIEDNNKIINMNEIMCVMPNEYGIAKITWERPHHNEAIQITIALFIIFIAFFLFLVL